MIDLEKINKAVETEVQRATKADHTRIGKLIKEAGRLLEDAIAEGADSIEEMLTTTDDEVAKPAPKPKAKAKPAVKKEAEEPKPKAKAKAKPAKEEEPEDDELLYDISEVDDEELEDEDFEDYMAMSLKELKDEFKERGLDVPKGFKKNDLIKYLILDDEADEE